MMRKWTLWLASVTLLIPGSVLALGLGDITVRSALNQPLNAEIELLSVRPGELEDIKASLASTEAFAQAGVERSFILTQLRFQVEKHKDGKPYLKVTTEQPVQEPFLNYLVEVNWASGHVLREYTVLLDPPTFKAGKQGPIQAPKTAATKPASSPFVTPPAEASKSSTDTASTDTASTATANKDTTLHPASSPFVEDIAAAGKSPTATPPQASSPFVSDATPADKPVSQTASSGQASSPFSTVSNPNYGPINKGQGLWSVAKGLLPDNSVSIQQMMLALLKVNPNAFVDDNINTLKANQTLRVPERSEITVISGMSRSKSIALSANPNPCFLG